MNVKSLLCLPFGHFRSRFIAVKPVHMVAYLNQLPFQSLLNQNAVQLNMY